MNAVENKLVFFKFFFRNDICVHVWFQNSDPIYHLLEDNADHITNIANGAYAFVVGIGAEYALKIQSYCLDEEDVEPDGNDMKLRSKSFLQWQFEKSCTETLSKLELTPQVLRQSEHIAFVYRKNKKENRWKTNYTVANVSASLMHKYDTTLAAFVHDDPLLWVKHRPLWLNKILDLHFCMFLAGFGNVDQSPNNFMLLDNADITKTIESLRLIDFSVANHHSCESVKTQPTVFLLQWLLNLFTHPQASGNVEFWLNSSLKFVSHTFSRLTFKQWMDLTNKYLRTQTHAPHLNNYAFDFKFMDHDSALAQKLHLSPNHHIINENSFTITENDNRYYQLTVFYDLIESRSNSADSLVVQCTKSPR